MIDKLADDLYSFFKRTPQIAASYLLPVAAITTIASIWQAGFGGTMPPILAGIASGIGVEALGHFLVKISEGENTNSDELDDVIKNIIEATQIEVLLKDEEFANAVDSLIRRFDVLGGAISVALQHHENTTVERILQGLSYYQNVGSREVISAVKNYYGVLNPETRYLSNLLYRLEGYEGTTEYVDLRTSIRALKGGQIGTSTHNTSVRKLVDRAFTVIPPTLSEKKDKLFEEKEDLNGIQEVMKKYEIFTLLGEPGSGKTTTLRYVALDLAWERLKNKKSPIPLFLELSKWNRLNPFEEFLLSNWNLDLDMSVALIRGDVFLLLDGLNEMGDGAEQNSKNLRAFIESKNRPKYVVVSCRTRDYVAELNLGTTVAVIHELNREEITLFVNNYLKEKANNFFETFQLSSEKRTTDFIDILLAKDKADEKKLVLARIMANPFLLRALMLIYETSPDAKLPLNSGALFKELVSYLWMREKYRNTSGWISYEEMLNRFAELANAMISDNKSTEVTTEYGLQFLNENLLSVAHDAGIIINNGNTITFFHQSLQEYFAAVYMKITGIATYDFVGEYVINSVTMSASRRATKWDEVVIALCGILDEVDSVIEEIMQRDIELAARCIASGIKVSEQLKALVVQKILDHPNWYLFDVSEIVRRFATSDEFVLILSAALKSPWWRVRLGVVTALGQIGTKQALLNIMHSINDDDIMVRERAIFYLLQPTWKDWTINTLLDRLQLPTKSEKLAAINALGILKVAAAANSLQEELTNEDYEIRRIALKYFSNLGVSNEKIIDQVILRLRDSVLEVRIAALNVLRQLRPPKAVPVLLQILETTSDPVFETVKLTLMDILDLEHINSLELWQQDIIRPLLIEKEKRKFEIDSDTTYHRGAM